jgi:hypothetical protein
VAAPAPVRSPSLYQSQLPVYCDVDFPARTIHLRVYLDRSHGQPFALIVHVKLTRQNLCENRARPVQKNACAGVSICMWTLMADNSADTARLLEQARAGNQGALNDLFARHRARLRRMVDLRLDGRLQARIDASDVIQEAFVEAVSRLDEYLREPSYPLFLWLRLIVGERLLKLHRHHLGTHMRDVGLEKRLKTTLASMPGGLESV